MNALPPLGRPLATTLRAEVPSADPASGGSPSPRSTCDSCSPEAQHGNGSQGARDVSGWGLRTPNPGAGSPHPFDRRAARAKAASPPPGSFSSLSVARGSSREGPERRGLQAVYVAPGTGARTDPAGGMAGFAGTPRCAERRVPVTECRPRAAQEYPPNHEGPRGPSRGAEWLVLNVPACA